MRTYLYHHDQWQRLLQLHAPAGTYTVYYGVVPASYGTVTPSSIPGGNSETGNAGVYAESASLTKAMPMARP
ncbi:MAG: hypothetical protein U0350_16285 [Caldilineaceae bacterium]